MSTDTIENFKEECSELLHKLKQERDELNLQMHLAKADAHDEWERLEKKWNHFQGKAATVGDAAAEASKEVGAATRILAEELKHGYQHIREAIAKESGTLI